MKKDATNQMNGISNNKGLLLVLYIIAVLGITSILYFFIKSENESSGISKVKQDQTKNAICTYAYYNGEIVWQNIDYVNLETNDSVKINSYNTAYLWIKKFKAIDSVKNASR